MEQIAPGFLNLLVSASTLGALVGLTILIGWVFSQLVEFAWEWLQEAMPR